MNKKYLKLNARLKASVEVKEMSTRAEATSLAKILLERLSKLEKEKVSILETLELLSKIWQLSLDLSNFTVGGTINSNEIRPEE